MGDWVQVTYIGNCFHNKPGVVWKVFDEYGYPMVYRVEVDDTDGRLAYYFSHELVRIDDGQGV
jgi:hypothetical protein